MTKLALRVLLVEDNESDAKLVKLALRELGDIVSQRVCDPPSFREALVKEDWDVILCDWSMPSFSARDALTILHESELDVPFLIVSGTVGEELAVEAMHVGAHDYLLKDKLTRLVPAVEREIREAKVRHERRRAERQLLERVQLSELAAEIGIAMTARTSFREMLQHAAEAIVRRLEVAFVRIWTLETKDVLELQASAGLDTRLDGRFSKVSLGQLEIGRVAETKRPFVTNDVPSDEHFADPEWARREGLLTFVGHPLLVGGDVVGVLALFNQRALSETALHALATIADAIAVAIHRSHLDGARERLAEQLRQAQKMEAVGRLAGGVAHDFNNLLSVILTYAELLLGELADENPMRDDIDEIRKAGVRAADLTRQLLMFSRRQVLEPRVLDLSEVLGGMEKMLRRLVGEDVALVFVQNATAKVRVDPGSLEQVIMNLAVNARDAMPTGGKLTITTTDVNVGSGHVMLHVADTGAGIDAVTLPRIFEPFFTTKEQSKGTGLGLSTVFGIVEQSGGSIKVESTVGVGTTFEILFPRADGAVESVRPRAPASTRGSETILLVEDERQVRTVAREILKREGYDVLEASNAGEALLFCERHRGEIHLLLTDVVMPQMSGSELAQRLAQVRPELKVIFMSGYTDDNVVRHGVTTAELSFVQKPFTPRSLAAKVREVLDDHRSRGPRAPVMTT